MVRKSTILIAIFLLAVASLAYLNSRFEKQELQTITPQEYDTIASKDAVFVIDVHIPEQEHLQGTDAFIPYNELEANADKLPQDKNTPIVVYCRSGSMSSAAAETLTQMGYTNIMDLVGGTDAYKKL